MSLTMKFLDLQFVFTNVLWKIKRNCMIGLFCIANLIEVGRKKTLFNFMDFSTLQTKMKYNIPIVSVRATVFL